MINKNEHTSASILIVDDMPSNISVLFETLSRSGYKVLVERDGKSAIEQIKYAWYCWT
jgi:formate hydrogenlyase transcriptional activator